MSIRVPNLPKTLIHFTWSNFWIFKTNINSYVRVSIFVRLNKNIDRKLLFVRLYFYKCNRSILELPGWILSQNASGGWSLFRHEYVMSYNSINFFKRITLCFTLKLCSNTCFFCAWVFWSSKVSYGFGKHLELTGVLQPEHPEEKTTHFLVCPQYRKHIWQHGKNKI